MFEPLHLATSDRIYASKEGFYVVIISSVINELREYNRLILLVYYTVFHKYKLNYLYIYSYL